MTIMTIKARISGRSKYDDKTVTAYKTAIYDDTATIAIELVERWGLVAAMSDGEDSAGRAKLRLMTPDEMVTRAFDTAERFTAMANERGHMVAMPDLNEINAENDAKDAARDQAART